MAIVVSGWLDGAEAFLVVCPVPTDRVFSLWSLTVLLVVLLLTSPSQALQDVAGDRSEEQPHPLPQMKLGVGSEGG